MTTGGTAPDAAAPDDSDEDDDLRTSHYLLDRFWRRLAYVALPLCVLATLAGAGALVLATQQLATHQHSRRGMGLLITSTVMVAIVCGAALIGFAYPLSRRGRHAKAKPLPPAADRDARAAEARARTWVLRHGTNDDPRDGREP
jgi:hypothetical protein